jgi:phage baseplate assembly protein W
VPYLVVDSSTITETSPYGLGISTQNIFQSQYKTLDQTISNLKMLLLTKKGELIGDINFGTDLVFVLFQPNANSDELKEQIDLYIRGPVQVYLPDITIETIDVKTAEEDPTLTNDIVVTLTISLDLINVSAQIIISANQTGTIIVQQNNFVGQ